VHGGANLLQHAGKFPSPLEHEFRISDDASRFYNSGKSFLYRSLPFWLASLVDRLLVVLVPIVIRLIPGLKLVPSLYRWCVKSRIYRWYDVLIALERSLLGQPVLVEREEVIKQLGDIETEVNKMKMPVAFADQFYVPRHHLRFVRDMYTNSPDWA